MMNNVYVAQQHPKAKIVTMHTDMYRGAAKHKKTPRTGGPTFSLQNRIERLIWNICWSFISWTPSKWMPVRRSILTLFGADISATAMIHGSAKIWLPRNLVMGHYSTIGPRVIFYNMDKVVMGEHALVSQGAHICCGSHDIDDPDFPLFARPITLGDNSWVAADAFVGPGVRLGEGAVVGASSATFKDVAPWEVVAGSPAKFIRFRKS